VKPVVRKHFNIPAIIFVAVYLEEILDDVARLGVFIFFLCLLICKRRLPLSRIYSIMKINQKLL
jgi:hypothetical protein